MKTYYEEQAEKVLELKDIYGKIEFAKSVDYSKEPQNERDKELIRQLKIFSSMPKIEKLGGVD